jgi:hypothetical protein
MTVLEPDLRFGLASYIRKNYSAYFCYVETKLAPENANDNLARFLGWKTLLVTFLLFDCFR